MVPHPCTSDSRNWAQWIIKNQGEEKLEEEHVGGSLGGGVEEGLGFNMIKIHYIHV